MEVGWGVVCRWMKEWGLEVRSWVQDMFVDYKDENWIYALLHSNSLIHDNNQNFHSFSYHNLIILYI